MALSEKFSHRGYVISVFAVCLGGVLIGFLLASTLTVNGVLVLGPDELLEWILVPLIPSFVRTVFGFALGLLEGLVLAFPLPAIFGRCRGEN